MTKSFQGTLLNYSEDYTVVLQTKKQQPIDIRDWHSNDSKHICAVSVLFSVKAFYLNHNNKYTIDVMYNTLAKSFKKHTGLLI